MFFKYLSIHLKSASDKNSTVQQSQRKKRHSYFDGKQ